MARNEEKAQAMLNRFVTAKKDANREDKSQRPYLASECSKVSDCEMYRNQIIKEISKKVSLIQNEGLEEHRVRDLNDAINKLMREKGHWERQIKSLGGPDYFRLAPKLLDEDAEEVVPGKGYKYYGAAKRLPGVRELFKKAAPEKAPPRVLKRAAAPSRSAGREEPPGSRARMGSPRGPAPAVGRRHRMRLPWPLAPPSPSPALSVGGCCWPGGQVKRTRHEIFKTINADYYGYRDDDDGVLVKLEAEAEEGLLEAKVAKWRETRQAAQGREGGGAPEEAEEAAEFVAHVEVPDQAAVQQAILARRKRELLASLAAGKEQEEPVELADIQRLPPSW